MDFSTIKLVPEFDTLSFPGAEKYHRPEDDGAAMTVEALLRTAGFKDIQYVGGILQRGCWRCAK